MFQKKWIQSGENAIEMEGWSVKGRSVGFYHPIGRYLSLVPPSPYTCSAVTLHL